jgi:5-methyltetrahydrofolate--homocysteine methyltransferase
MLVMILKPDWQKEKKIFTEWWDFQLDRPLIQIIDLKDESIELEDVSSRKKDFLDYSWAFLKYYPNIKKALIKILKEFSKVHFIKEAYPNIWINIGPGALALYLGAEIKYDDYVKTAWINGNFTLEEIIEMDFNTDNKWWKYTIEACKILSRECEGKAIVGFPDFHENIDALAQLRGNFPINFVRDIFLKRELVKKALEKLDDLFFLYFKNLCQLINTKKYGYSTWAWLWNEESYNIAGWDLVAYLSPKQFQEFVLPSLIDQCYYFKRVIWHLDGPLELTHLDTLLSIKELDGIQWIPGAGNPDPGDQSWLPLYKKILLNGKLLQLVDVPLEKLNKLLLSLPNNGRNVAILTICSSFHQKKLLKELPFDILDG